MIFHYRCYLCGKACHLEHVGSRHQKIVCPCSDIRMMPDGITYDEVVKCQTGPKASEEREPSSSGNTGQ